jgi:hypothetical protein
VTLWIVNALWGGYTAANVLKWYWWRLNGYGYFWGMVTGIAAALLFPWLLPSVAALYAFPYILALSLAGCIAGSYATRPEPDDVLMNFYMRVRPWGFWRPVLLKVRERHPEFQPNKGFKRDMVNVVVGIVWQSSLVALPIYIVIQETTYLILTAAVTLVTSILLKLNWWNRLDETSRETAEGGTAPLPTALENGEVVLAGERQ